MNTTDIKNELYDRVLKAFAMPLTKTELGWILENIIDIMQDAIVNGDGVLLLRLGKLQLTTRAARTYIVHGEEHAVGERSTVTFKVSNSLKKRLNPN